MCCSCAGRFSRSRLRQPPEHEIAERLRLAIERARVPAETVVGKGMGLDRAPRRMRPAHRLIEHVERSALADGAQHRAQRDGIDRALGNRRRIERRQLAQHGVLGREDAEIDERARRRGRAGLRFAPSGLLELSYPMGYIGRCPRSGKRRFLRDGWRACTTIERRRASMPGSGECRSATPAT
jgi:hypothetical protein